MRLCDVCAKEYSAGIGYELRDDKGKLIEKKFGHQECIQVEIDALRIKINKEKVK